jgi:Ca-activated chloride channel family protein
MLLRDSEHSGDARYRNVIRLAEAGQGNDPEGYRAEFVNLVKTARTLTGR